MLLNEALLAHRQLSQGHFARLVPATDRELHEEGGERAQQQAEEAAAHASEAFFRALSEHASDMELSLAYDTTIEGWSRALDVRDRETEGHSRRVTELTLRLARAFGMGEGRPALDIPYCHHERWDGTGYPRRLKGERIPLAARIFAVVDVWDALRSDRPYRPAWQADKAREHIRSQAGKHFDPQVVAAFLQLKDELAVTE